MSLRGILLLCRLITLHCHRVNTSSMGGKISCTKLLGMKMMRKLMTTKDISIMGV